MRNNKILKNAFIICAIFLNVNLYSQNIISRDPLDYPGGDVPGICGTDPSDPDCIITLAPALPEQDYYFQIPLISEPRDNCSFTIIQTTTCESGSQIANSTSGDLDMPAATRCNPVGADSYLEIEVIVNIISGPNVGQIDNQKYILPIYRNPLKVVLVLDVSSSMGLVIPDGTETRWNVLKNSVNLFTEEFEKYYQEGDSISLIYYSKDTIMPGTPIDSNFIAITPEDFTPSSLKSSEIINADILSKTLQDSAAMGNALLLAKAKLQNTDATKVVILFTDGYQDVDPLVHKLDGNKLYNGEFLNDGPCSAIDSIGYYTIGLGSTGSTPIVLENIALASGAENLNTTTGEISDPQLNWFFQNQFDDLLNGNRKAIDTRIIDLSPFDDSLNVPVDRDLKITFNETVSANTGYISIKRIADDSEFEKIDVTSDLVTGSGSSIITINPENNLESNTEYYIIIDDAAFKNDNDNTVTGISTTSFWNFTTEDIVPPTVSVTSLEPNPTNTNSFEINVEFSEEINGFNISDIEIINGSANNLTTEDSITFISDITPIEDGLVTVSVPENSASDNAGNYNTASNNFEISFDSTAPSVSISSLENNPTNTSPFSITIEFSEEINKFHIDDIEVINGSVDNLTTTDSIQFSSNITPEADGLVIANINADAAHDNSGNPNSLSNRFEINFDSTRPSVVLNSDNDTTVNISFDTYITFSERICGFDNSKINVHNGSISSLSTSDSVYFVASITAIEQGETNININENVVADSAGNMNTQAEELTVTYYIPTNIEILEKEGISIYTNKDYVIIDLKRSESTNIKSGHIEIYSINGSLIKKENFEITSHFETDLNNQKGIFLVKLMLDKKVYFSKIQN